jgi:hypothetical protein
MMATTISSSINEKPFCDRFIMRKTPGSVFVLSSHDVNPMANWCTSGANAMPAESAFTLILQVLLSCVVGVYPRIAVVIAPFKVSFSDGRQILSFVFNAPPAHGGRQK